MYMQIQMVAHLQKDFLMSAKLKGGSMRKMYVSNEVRTLVSAF